MTHDDPYHYKARLYPMTPDYYPDGIIDGDTQDVIIDLGFFQFAVERLRLTGVDTHETHGVKEGSDEYEKGMAEKEFVKDWYATAEEEWDGIWPVHVWVDEYNHRGMYGRVIATVERSFDEEVLNERLIEEFDNVEAD